MKVEMSQRSKFMNAEQMIKRNKFHCQRHSGRIIVDINTEMGNKGFVPIVKFYWIRNPTSNLTAKS